MTAAPTVLRAAALGRLLGRSTTWFYQHRRALEKAGFPAKDALLGGWHRPAVEAWLAKRAGIAESLSVDAERDAMRGDVHAQAERRHALRHH
jgi:predicted DNA-binding transcriptional regulator AlpA